MIFSNGVYNPLLVIVSLLIAICASYTTLELIRRVASSTGRTATVWLFAGAVSMGCGIWSMHFIGMLAFSMAMPYEYDVTITALSLLVGIIVSLFAIRISTRKMVGPIRLICSGVALGLGIAGMHYTGMAAMKMEAKLVYDPVLFTASVVIAIVAAIAALWIALQTRSNPSWKLQTAAAVVMGFAICGMHYTGMAAARYIPPYDYSMAGHAMDAIEAGNNNWLAVAVVLSTFIIIAFTHLTIFFDYKLDQHKDLGEKLGMLVDERTFKLQQQTDDLLASKRRLEEEMQEKEIVQSELSMLGKILDDSLNEIYIFDAETFLFKLVNKGARDNLGYSMAELAKMTPWEVKPRYDKETFKKLIRPLLSGTKERLLFHAEHQRKDGSVYPIEVRLQISAAVEHPIFVATVEDSTERRHRDHQLLQSQKLESIGQLAAGIAHEINTPTQYVGDNTRFLQDGFNDLLQVIRAFEELLLTVKSGAGTDAIVAQVEDAIDKADMAYLKEEIPKAITQSLDGISRVSRIVRAMKEFSHPGGMDKEPVDINRLIENTVTVASNEWKYVADVQYRFDDGLAPVSCYPQEMSQVMLNMIVNAAHAIEVRAGHRNARTGTITIGTRQMTDGMEIRVSDDGSGIPEAARGKIFDPFFTTKEVGKGTGQGLSMVHASIVDKHAGSIRFETEIGKGTTFFITLPTQHDAIAA